MFHHTYDRLQGSWWGAIVAQKLTEHTVNEFSFYSQPWLIQRRKLATALLEGELPPSSSGSGDRSDLLARLPLIVFSTASPTLHLEKTLPDSPKSGIAQIEAEEDRLGWSYLLYTVLNYKFGSFAQNELIESGYKYCRATESLLADKLRLIGSSIENGDSLNLAIEKLSASEALTSSAIALAWYCFVTTPYDFDLSVRRAALVPENLTWLTIALTGTLSGAYNGMAEISRYWRSDEKNPHKQLEQDLLQKLFTEWLGIYAGREQLISFNPNLDAVALPQIIQPRLSLKIISQISNLK